MAIRNGEQYLASLRDGLRVIWNGEPVHDVTTAPGFDRSARSIAQFHARRQERDPEREGDGDDQEGRM